MSFKTFRGGIMPFDGKELTKDKEVEEYLPQKDLVFPMLMHKGKEAFPTVSLGDYVLRGQMIGDGSGEGTAPIHASISGTVVDVRKNKIATGGEIEAIVVKNDNEYKEVEFEKTLDYTSLSSEIILEKIKKAGIVGMSGSGIPTYDKLTKVPADEIETIIVNGIECEPYFTCDYRSLMEDNEKVIHGIKILLQVFTKAKAIIALTENNMECAQKLTSNVSVEEKISIEILEQRYPQGSERQLVQSLTGKFFTSSQIATDIGCLVVNVQTLVAIYEAVVSGKPLMNRIITVSGDGILNPGNYYVCIGTNMQELIDIAGGMKETAVLKIAGGPMMGTKIEDWNTPITKITSGLTVLTKNPVNEKSVADCIRCGRCSEVCPQLLVPAKLWKYAIQEKEAFFEKWHGLECIECGSCSFICPAKLDLTSEICSMKNLILEKNQNLENAKESPEDIKSADVKESKEDIKSADAKESQEDIKSADIKESQDDMKSASEEENITDQEKVNKESDDANKDNNTEDKELVKGE